MGRMSLIIVLGLIIISGSIFVTVKKVDVRSNENIASNAYSVDRNFSAKDVLDHAIQLHLKQKGISDSDTSWLNCITSISSEKISSSDAALDTVLFDAKVRINEIERPMKAYVVYNAKNYPYSPGSVNIHGNQARVSLVSVASIDGNNWKMDGSEGDDEYDKYGIALTRADTTNLKMDMGDDTTKVYGINKTPSMTKIDEGYYEDVDKYIQLYKGIADVTITDGDMPGGQYGTSDDPVVVYANGRTSMSGDVDGYGILAIEGSFSTTDTYTLDWKGLVICEPEADSSSVTLYLADSSAIYGSLVTDASAVSSVNCVGEVSFAIVDDEVVPGADYQVRIEIIGAELSGSGGRGDVGVSAIAYIGGSEIYSWSDVRYAEQDAYVDRASQPSPEYYIWEDDEDESHAAGEAIKVQCAFWDGWPTISSDENSDHLIVLRNGDSAPSMTGSSGQESVETWLKAYVNTDDGTMQLGENQAIYLFDANEKTSTWPSWEDHSDWWLEKGYHYASESSASIEVEYWEYYNYGWHNDGYTLKTKYVTAPTDQNSYEYWDFNYESDKKVSDYYYERSGWWGSVTYYIYPYREYFLENYCDYDDRDFQDCVVLATLSTLSGPDSLSIPVKIRNCQEAIDKVHEMLSGVNADTTLKSINWWGAMEDSVDTNDGVENEN